MKKAMKWGMAIVGLLVVLIVGAVIVVPMVVDVNQYKPRIEALVSEQTGRTFTMGDDIDLSVFPWVGVRLTDVALGNAKGFSAGKMVSVKSFEVRLKVMPLLSRQIEVASFILDSPQIALEKNAGGTGNWENIGPAGGSAASGADRKAEAGPSAKETQGLPITSLSVGRCAIVNGTLSYTDAATGMKNTVSDLNVELTDISLDRPVKLELSALVDGRPLSLSGSAGPVGSNPGKEDITLDLALKAMDTLSVTVKGTLLLAGKTPGIDATVAVASFSPRALFEKLGQPFPVETRDPKVLDKVSLTAAVKGSAQAVTLSDGKMVLDDSTLTFSAGAKAFEKPDIRFDLDLDKIDADRYLPPRKEGGTDGGSTGGGATSSDSSGNSERSSSRTASSGIDYTPLRKLVLDGKARIGEFKVANLTMTNVTAQIKGNKGIFNLDPFSVDLYEGSSVTKARINVQGKVPTSEVAIDTKGVQAGPLIRDGAGKDIIEGALAADIALTMTGDTPETIRQTLGGKGELTFTDGAIVGIDIAGTIRNAAAGLGLSDKASEKPRTDFAELKIPYTASKGVVTIPGASLVSLLRLAASGNTNLVSEALDFKVEPKLVATLKGQGDTKSRSGLLIPLLVKGTWQDPKIRPDMEGLLKQKAADPEAIKSLIKGEGDSGGSVEDKAKSLIKGLFN